LLESAFKKKKDRARKHTIWLWGLESVLQSVKDVVSKNFVDF
jgi:hypothetical protein